MPSYFNEEPNQNFRKYTTATLLAVFFSVCISDDMKNSHK